jgi:hypothetical protein
MTWHFYFLKVQSIFPKMSFVRRKIIVLLYCICIVSVRKIGRRNKRYYNGLKGVTKRIRDCVVWDYRFDFER